MMKEARPTKQGAARASPQRDGRAHGSDMAARSHRSDREGEIALISARFGLGLLARRSLTGQW